MTRNRLDTIVAKAKADGEVAVDDLAAEFAVTPQTIRKDLNDLCERGVLNRTHGGAIFPSGVENVEYERRRQIAAREKASIGRAAASLIANGASLFINLGTTTEAVSRALGQSDPPRDGLMAITNNINVANHLRSNPRFEVVVAGGIVRASDGGIVGEATVDFISQFKVDDAIIGVSAIDADGALLDYDYREVRVSRAIMTNARRVILVADATKFERQAPVRIGHLAQVDVFVTDRCPSEEIRRICEDAGTLVIETDSQ